MAEKILIMGESGTGKTASLRDFKPDEVAIVNPIGKPLPFRGKYEMLNNVTDSRTINDYMDFVVQRGKKIIVIDDFQYILAIPYMNRIKESGWDKYNDFGSNYFEIIEHCAKLPSDVTVYFLTHLETLDSGLTTVKLIGKLLREKITIEGLFTIVLRTYVADGKYYFLTQNSGKDTVKSPIGMFDSYAINNSLSYVDSKIRNYYQFDGAKTDEEMKDADKEAEAPEIEKGGNGRTRRSRREEKPVEEQQEEAPKQRRSRLPKEEAPDFTDVDPIPDEELPWYPEGHEEEQPEQPEEAPKRVRRTRKER